MKEKTRMMPKGSCKKIVLCASEINSASARIALTPESSPIIVTLLGATSFTDEAGKLTVTDTDVVFEGKRKQLVIALNEISELWCEGANIIIRDGKRKMRFNVPDLDENAKGNTVCAKVQPRRNPICNIMALVLPMLFVIWSLFYRVDGFQGFGYGLLLILLFFGVCIPISLIFAIVAVLRNERLFALAFIQILLYSGILLYVIGSIWR